MIREKVLVALDYWGVASLLSTEQSMSWDGSLLLIQAREVSDGGGGEIGGWKAARLEVQSESTSMLELM